MATNTFSTVRAMQLQPRSKFLYTFTLVMLPRNSNDLPSFRSVYTHGTLAMSGWIRDSGGVPQRRVVELAIWPANEVVARTESDPANGGNNYFFNGLQTLEPHERYVLRVYNADGSTAARIKDNRIPV